MIPGTGFVLEHEATAEQLRLASDSQWMAGRPSDSLKGISRAKRPQITRGRDLADAERAVLANQWIGEEQRKTILAEIPWLEAFLVAHDAATSPAG